MPGGAAGRDDEAQAVMSMFGLVMSDWYVERLYRWRRRVILTSRLLAARLCAQAEVFMVAASKPDIQAVDNWATSAGNWTSRLLGSEPGSQADVPWGATGDVDIQVGRATQG